MEVNKKNIFDFSFTDVEGHEIFLDSFRGKYILIVNVASECGFTKQYQQLQELNENYKEKIAIIGFPCNDFGGQEPGSEEEIKAFCEREFNVDFTIASKINIKVSPINEIYNWLCHKSENGVIDSSVDWNFQKYLIGKNGELLHVLNSNISPFDNRIISVLESV